MRSLPDSGGHVDGTAWGSGRDCAGLERDAESTNLEGSYLKNIRIRRSSQIRVNSGSKKKKKRSAPAARVN